MSFKTVNQLSATTTGPVRPLGPAFLAHAQRIVRNRTWSQQEKLEEEERAKLAASQVRDDDGLEDEDADEELLNHDPIQWKDADQYAALGLSNLRWRATPDQVVKAHRRQVLKYHPDKQAAKGNSNDGFFKIIQKAFEILSDPTKRKQWDSVDKQANVAAPKKNAGGDFFEKWGKVFESEGRFSNTQPVPQLGDANSPKADVDHFYHFWYAFDSWRTFEWLDEDVPDDSSNRDNKRYIEKKNKAARQKHKKDDSARVRKLVDTALAEDPRIKAFKEAEKAAREQKKWDREAGARAEAERKAKEAAEAEEKAKQQAVAQADAKKLKEQAKNAKKKNKRAIRGAAKTLEDSIADKAQAALMIADVDLIIEKLNDIQLTETAEKSAKLSGDELSALFAESAKASGVSVYKLKKQLESYMIPLPDVKDFTPLEVFEKETPQSFGLPEQPVVYYYKEFSYQTVLLSSEGVYLGNKNTQQADFILLNEITSKTIPPELWTPQFDLMLKKCQQHAQSSALEDNFELAVSYEYETGDCDDLGEEQLAECIGQGAQLRSGPATSIKRRRS